MMCARDSPIILPCPGCTSPRALGLQSQNGLSKENTVGTQSRKLFSTKFSPTCICFLHGYNISTALQVSFRVSLASKCP